MLITYLSRCSRTFVSPSNTFVLSRLGGGFVWFFVRKKVEDYHVWWTNMSVSDVLLNSRIRRAVRPVGLMSCFEKSVRIQVVDDCTARKCMMMIFSLSDSTLYHNCDSMQVFSEIHATGNPSQSTRNQEPPQTVTAWPPEKRVGLKTSQCPLHFFLAGMRLCFVWEVYKITLQILVVGGVSNSPHC